MANPETLNNCLEGSLIPEDFLGREWFITSGNRERVIEWECGPGATDEVAMRLSLFFRWGMGYRQIITASVQENQARGERQLRVSLAATSKHQWRNSKGRFQGEILAVEYSSENDGQLSKKPGRVELLETLQYLSDRGMFAETQLPPQIDLEATVRGFVADFQEILALQEAGDLPQEFPIPWLVPLLSDSRSF